MRARRSPSPSGLRWSNLWLHCACSQGPPMPNCARSFRCLCFARPSRSSGRAGRLFARSSAGDAQSACPCACSFGLQKPCQLATGAGARHARRRPERPVGKSRSSGWPRLAPRRPPPSRHCSAPPPAAQSLLCVSVRPTNSPSRLCRAPPPRLAQCFRMPRRRTSCVCA